MRIRTWLTACLAVLPRLLQASPAVAAASGDVPVLRVCADPNNLPFSNSAGEGFENKLAELVARELGARVEYTWWAQRRGFVRSTLKAGQCDVVMGVPTGYQQLLTTRPYYGSGYVLVYRRAAKLALTSLDDPKFEKLRIGVHLIGGDSPPPALALARRGIIRNVAGFNLFGDYREPNPPARLIDAVVHGDIDVAIAWGPLAGYFAQHSAQQLTVVPLPAADGPLPFRFQIAMGVRKGDRALKERLDHALAALQPRINALLVQYGVPLLEGAQVSHNDQP